MRCVLASKSYAAWPLAEMTSRMLVVCWSMSSATRLKAVRVTGALVAASRSVKSKVTLLERVTLSFMYLLELEQPLAVGVP